MNALLVAVRQVRFENKAFWRNPASAFFTFAFPLVFLVLFTALFEGETVRLESGREIGAPTFYVASVLAFAVINACYTNLATSLPVARDEGLLKRVRGTPFPLWGFVAAKIAHAVLMMSLLVAIVAAFGAVVFDTALPTNHVGAFLLTLVVGCFCFCSLGIATAAFIPNAPAAPAIVNGVILPLLFISGIFFPVGHRAAWLTTVAELFPVKHFADATKSAYFGTGADALRPSSLVWVAAWGVAGLVLAARFVSREPRS